MTKFLVLSMLVFVASAQAQFYCWRGECGDPIRMPEPSAIPELVLCAAGLGLYAWKKHKSAR